MHAAWETIKKHPKITTTVDVYFFGIAFFNEDIKEKQDFKIIPKRYKPWQIDWI